MRGEEMGVSTAFPSDAIPGAPRSKAARRPSGFVGECATIARAGGPSPGGFQPIWCRSGSRQSGRRAVRAAGPWNPEPSSRLRCRHARGRSCRNRRGPEPVAWRSGWASRSGRPEMENARMIHLAIDAAFGPTDGCRGADGHAGYGDGRSPDRPESDAEMPLGGFSPARERIASRGSPATDIGAGG